MEGDEQGGNDLLAALKHPLRRRLLSTMLETNVKTSPVRLAKEIGEPLANVSYHVNVLRERGVIRLVDTEPRRGAVEHFYETTPLQPWALAVLGLEEDEPTTSDGPDEMDADGEADKS